MTRFLACCSGLMLALALPANDVRAADEKPLWEIGAGVSALTLPAYRGSDQTNNFILPLPFFSYHGDFFKADRHGIRGSFFDTDRLDFTVSLALSPPMGSNDIPVRAGMPDLKAADIVKDLPLLEEARKEAQNAMERGMDFRKELAHRFGGAFLEKLGGRSDW